MYNAYLLKKYMYYTLLTFSQKSWNLQPSHIFLDQSFVPYNIKKQK